MMAKLFDAIFGCGHNHCSFPITVRSRARSEAANLTGTYVVCLDCGKEMPCDWQAMKVIASPAAKPDPLRPLAAKPAA